MWLGRWSDALFTKSIRDHILINKKKNSNINDMVAFGGSEVDCDHMLLQCKF